MRLQPLLKRLGALGITLLLLSLLACGNSLSGGQNGQPGQAASSAKGAARPVPPTQTSCPRAGTARAAVLANLALGHDNNLVYVANEFQDTSLTPKAGTLKRYDVKTGTSTVIVSIPQVEITSAQVSADGQWLLFSTANSDNSLDQLQLVRLDGQGLQTLFCSSHANIDNPQWSSDQKHVIFQGYPGVQETLFLLTMATGQLQTLITISPGLSTPMLVARAWLDTTHIYLSNGYVDRPHDKLYLLDINHGPHQNLNSLSVIVNKSFEDFTLSYDGQQLYVDYSVCHENCNPPSTITLQPATGGAQKAILTELNYHVMTIRAATARSLLLIIENNPSTDPKDTLRNGLWRMNPDGSDLTRLTSDSADQSSWPGNSPSSSWSNVSRDGQTYALETQQTSPAFTYTYALEYGALSGGSPTIFTSVGEDIHLGIVGWTTM